jgi:hypothetical protein
MKTLLLRGATLFSILGPGGAFAGSATWNLNPGDGDWNKPANWTPATVPNGPGDIAGFDFSNLPSVGLSASAEVGSLVFNPGAAIYSISPRPGNVLTISATGITNSSGQLQSFATTVTGSGKPGEIFLLIAPALEVTRPFSIKVAVPSVTERASSIGRRRTMARSQMRAVLSLGVSLSFSIPRPPAYRQD